MSLNTIKKISEAEDAAETNLLRAKERAADILNQAQKEAQRLLNEAKEKAALESEALVATTTKESVLRTKKLTSQTVILLIGMRPAIEERIDQAAATVVNDLIGV